MKISISCIIIFGAALIRLPAMDPAIALTGGYDTRLGDQWGVALITDGVIIGATVGGFVSSGAADDAAEILNTGISSDYGFDPEIDGDTLTYSIFAGYFFYQDTLGGAYGGIGYSAITSDAELDDIA